jgi:hypothetical protein
MAKGKHAAALFEVIHSDRRFGKKASPADKLSTPKWWFKGKGKDRATLATPVAGATHTVPAPAPVQSASAPIDYMPSVPNDTSRAAPAVVDVKVDSDRQEIAFKLTYTSAAVGAFALAVVLGLAYLVGKRMSQGPQAAVAGTASTNLIRKGAPQPGVLDLTKAASDAKGAPSSIFPDGHDESANVIDRLPDNANPKSGVPAASPTAVKPFDGKRIVNKNYVVMQSFPESEKELAEQAVKRLHESGIGATIEQGLKGWPSTWCSVVGTLPFESTRNNPVYEAYYKSIMEVSTKYAGKSQFKKFEPMIKKWQEN